MPIVFKAIKAKPENWQAFYAEIAETLDNVVKPEVTAYFNAIVASWKHKPQFKARKIISQKVLSVDVKPYGPNRKIWEYVSFGTRAHPIPRPGNTRAKTLRFKTHYQPRTSPSGSYRGPGKASGKEIFRKRVHHPGNKARNFEKHIARWYAPKFNRTMKNAVARALRRAKSATH